jgi:hypothetical protein
MGIDHVETWNREIDRLVYIACNHKDNAGKHDCQMINLEANSKAKVGLYLLRFAKPWLENGAAHRMQHLDVN